MVLLEFQLRLIIAHFIDYFSFSSIELYLHLEKHVGDYKASVLVTIFLDRDVIQVLYLAIHVEALAVERW